MDYEARREQHCLLRRAASCECHYRMRSVRGAIRAAYRRHSTPLSANERTRAKVLIAFAGPSTLINIAVTETSHTRTRARWTRRYFHSLNNCDTKTHGRLITRARRRAQLLSIGPAIEPIAAGRTSLAGRSDRRTAA